MSPETTASLSITRVIKADRGRVFRAWTEVDQIRKWSCPEGVTLLDATADLRVGGAYSLTMKTDEDTTLVASGSYREVESPSRLVYTWDWDHDEHAVGETLVTVEFKELGDATEVVLTHDLLPSAEARDGHEQGWGSCLNQLETLFR
jgi:uncharacterized protein YndB with AHSA1/START domain